MCLNHLVALIAVCHGYGSVMGERGWTLVDKRYDDGGFTDANIDRPEFTRLMAGLDAAGADVIVVHKVDRSPAPFSTS